MTNPKLYIITDYNFLMDDFIFEEFKEDEDIVHIHFNRKKSALCSILKFLRLKSGNRKGLFNKLIFNTQFLESIKKIEANDTVLLWSIENYKDTLLIAKEITAQKKISFLWNTMLRLRREKGLARKYMPDMTKNGISVCTFDPGDSKMLPCRLMPQVHRCITLPSLDKEASGVFFVGVLKGRETVLSDLEKEFTDSDIDVNFHLIRGRHDSCTIPENLIKYMSTEFMSYQDTLSNINKSECLLDIVQQNQKGLTLRSIEALFYHKKLVTNNLAIKHEPFYNVNNIYIIGDPAENRSIKEFIKATPYIPVDKNVEQRYHIRNWLNELLEGV